LSTEIILFSEYCWPTDYT